MEGHQNKADLSETTFNFCEKLANTSLQFELHEQMEKVVQLLC
jgi:hypothetical protein